MEKVKRQIKWLIVHCAFTKTSMDIDADVIDRWHRNKGWSGIGYNWFVKLDGTLENGRPLKKRAAAAIGLGANSKGFHVCYAGGMGKDGKPEDNINPDQMFSILKLFRELKEIYPDIKIAGHNQFDAKACPCFDMRVYAKKHGIDSESIFHRLPLIDI